ncbi:unnamed protein product [Bemisia tabaci]|uniref:Gamma-glutamyltranspeptidase n=1 Tax=Bemisia tabaci TaxID=7038 RepID=A0A9P0A1P7_BEMTA|nr:unnamed protein product [Bemisia tabaci]
MPLLTSALYRRPESEVNPFPSRRSVVHSAKGIIASSQPLATACGLEILSKGGNCADAAVAVAAGLSLTEPGNTGLGGDMFCLFYDAKTKKVHSLNGSGRAGSLCTLEAVREELGLLDGQEGKIPLHSVHAVTVPGTAAGWVDTVELFGSGKVSLEEILEPAVKLAEEGFPVSELAAFSWKESEDKLRQASLNGSEMLKKDPSAKDGFRAPEAGEIMKNPTLANTFRLLAKHKKAGFYTGPVAEALVKVVQDLGGYLTLDDLKHHMEMGTEKTEPIKFNFKAHDVAETHGEHMSDGSRDGIDVWEHPPNGQGIVALIALGIIEELQRSGRISKFSAEEHNSVRYLHVVIEALRIAFSDANWWVSDPSFSQMPAKALLDPKYIAERAAIFSPDKAADICLHGLPVHSSSDTVYFAVTDSDGNGISFINSNYHYFGTGIIPKGCGFPLQNRGANFVLQPSNHPNILAPRKRPYHTIIPALVTNASDQSLHSVYGVKGGFMQPQGHVQVLLNQLVFRLDPQAALDSPRFCIGPGMTNKSNEYGDMIFLEDGISAEAVEGLKRLGHKVELLKGRSREMFGTGQVIRFHVDVVDGQGVWSAGSDQRGDGAAVPVI